MAIWQTRKQRLKNLAEVNRWDRGLHVLSVKGQTANTLGSAGQVAKLKILYRYLRKRKENNYSTNCVIDEIQRVIIIENHFL